MYRYYLIKKIHLFCFLERLTEALSVTLKIVLPNIILYAYCAASKHGYSNYISLNIII